MIFRLFRRGPADGTIDALYGAIVAQARIPTFYLSYGVPDTAEGRFEMIVLHVALVCRRLGQRPAQGDEKPPGRNQLLSQQVFDMFCRDMDDNLREMGVGDLSVPKTMQKLGEAFYGRLKAYDLALGGNDSLTEALARNVLERRESTASARRLAAYVAAAARLLDETPDAAFAAGAASFPAPEAIAWPVTETQS
jgi:cytochrome b pre-mRNA-processing protein 3